jgi:Ala-tRNA(Pro) deacylase
MLPQKIKKFLESKKVKYELLEHKTVYTAFDKAATLKVPLKRIGKTVIVSSNQKLAIVLIPGDKKIDLKKIKKFLGNKVKLASEKKIQRAFSKVKLGAIPPFGDIWKVPTLVDKKILKEKKIILNGGDHSISIQISPSNLKKLLSNAIFGTFTQS